MMLPLLLVEHVFKLGRHVVDCREGGTIQSIFKVNHAIILRDGRAELDGARSWALEERMAGGWVGLNEHTRPIQNLLKENIYSDKNA